MANNTVSKQTEALKLALGYMDGTLVTDHLTGYERKRYVMEAIREALAEQPAQQQEPVAWWPEPRDSNTEYPPSDWYAEGWNDCLNECWEAHQHHTSPPASKPWVGLTNQELIDLTAIYSGAPLYCAIEAKLKEKNT